MEIDKNIRFLREQERRNYKECIVLVLTDKDLRGPKERYKIV